ncbi:MAG: hypothetical protein ACRDXE_07505 [Acidimicrobiales bacterium]
MTTTADTPVPAAPAGDGQGLKTGAIGALVVGVVAMEIFRWVSPPFFRGRTLNRDTAVLVPEEGSLADVPLATDGGAP